MSSELQGPSRIMSPVVVVVVPLCREESDIEFADASSVDSSATVTPDKDIEAASVDTAIETEKAQKEIDTEPLEKDKQESTPVINASLVLLYAILSSMFIIGSISFNSCPINRLIPVYLIVAGFTGILTKVIMHTRNKYVFHCVMVLVLFDIIWQGLGSYWVYSIYQPNYDPDRGIYCNRVAYLLAFWMLTSFYILVSLFILLSVCWLLMRRDFVLKK